uniref:Intracellular protein transport protein USO1-like n=1 Tax=Tanacetum cinerariifolium TaxID=118510 RepID=A0A6L2JI01_TANCI|nr:intracellular protein transport protein USO1-like [Tanacetum cinerariifolium]
MSSANQVEKIKQLEGDICTYKASIDQAIIERNEALESLDKEKSITSDIKEKITIMKQEIEGLREELGNMTTEIKKFVGMKSELEENTFVKRFAAEARTRKSFWTMVSSATTLLAAAASFAYVARAH